MEVGDFRTRFLSDVAALAQAIQARLGGERPVSLPLPVSTPAGTDCASAHIRAVSPTNVRQWPIEQGKLANGCGRLASIW